MPLSKLRPSFTLTEDRLKELHTVVPEAFADGRINWDTLREALGETLEDESKEHFGLFWPGKREARRLAAMPSKGTLIPQPGEGIDEENTHNLFIEGENLEVLKLLKKSYAGRVKIIYIDPPYNSKKDFVYEDDFTEPLEQYLQKLGKINDEGIVLTSNTEASGRFHSLWLSSILPRLLIARSLLTDDGVIFISIDDRELHHLRTLLNEVFGDENFLASFVWVNEGNIDNQSKIKTNHEYILAYAKNNEKISAAPVIDPNIPLTSKLYKDAIENTIVKNGPKNPVSEVTLPIGFPANFKEGVIEPKKDVWPKLNKKLIVKDFKTQNEVIVSSGWSSKDIFENFISSGFQPVIDTKDQNTVLYVTDTGAIYAKKDRPETQSHVITVLKNMGTVQAAASSLAEMGVYFDYPKPIELLKYLLKVGNSKDSIVMDFYAGSCPLAQATYEINQEDNGNRKYICVQIQESTSENSTARKNGFKTVAEIGKKRIRSSLKTLKADKRGKLNLDPNEDLGFKVYALARSNFQDWQLFTGKDISQLELQFEQSETPLVEDWKPEHLLAEILLLQGFPLDSKVHSLHEFKVNDVQHVTSEFVTHPLFVCLDKKIKPETVSMLKLSSEDIFVCLDSALSDEAKVKLADQCNLKVI